MVLLNGNAVSEVSFALRPSTCRCLAALAWAMLGSCKSGSAELSVRPEQVQMEDDFLLDPISDHQLRPELSSEPFRTAPDLDRAE